MKEKSALITGSTSGLGFAIANALAGAGCNILLHGLEAPSEMESCRKAIEDAHGVSAHYLRADLRDAEAIEDLMAKVQTLTGGADILVNNAVVRHFASIEDFPTSKWEEALAINLSAAFHTIRLALPGMRARQWGRIFNMTSVYSLRGTPNRIDYVTTKSALLGMTRCVAAETINQGITCNTVCPGTVHTPSIENRLVALMSKEGLDRDAALRRFLDRKQPTARFIDASQVGSLIVFLCSPAASSINGAMLPIDDGWLAAG
ncbi:SDR family oxidoreductase [Castellaniella sp. GW247-6E4]|uniref:SDR family oxidoreductase n=1 Tax=Castellaniella sp. GW247-6E4 TaxID=3140380 RepID=UPI00331631E6